MLRWLESARHAGLGRTQGLEDGWWEWPIVQLLVWRPLERGGTHWVTVRPSDPTPSCAPKSGDSSRPRKNRMRGCNSAIHDGRGEKWCQRLSIRGRRDKLCGAATRWTITRSRKGVEPRRSLRRGQDLDRTTLSGRRQARRPHTAIPFLCNTRADTSTGTEGGFAAAWKLGEMGVPATGLD